MEEDNNEAGLLEALAAQGCCKLPSTIAHLRPQEVCPAEARPVFLIVAISQSILGMVVRPSTTFAALFSLYSHCSDCLQEGTWCPSVTALQQRYLRRCGSEEATAVNGPASTSASVAETLPGGVSGWQLELAAELVITQAPAAITLAVPANHRLDPPFKISLHLASMVPLKAQVSVGACLVDSQEVASLSSWTPRGPGADNLLEGAEAQATIVLRESGHLSTDGGSIFSSSHEFVFPDLVFRHPTNVSCWVALLPSFPPTRGHTAVYQPAIIEQDTISCNPMTPNLSLVA